MNTTTARPPFVLGVDASPAGRPGGIVLVERKARVLRMRYGERAAADAVAASVLRVAAAPEVTGRLHVVANGGTEMPGLPVTRASPDSAGLLQTLWELLRQERLVIAGDIAGRADLEQELTQARGAVAAAGAEMSSSLSPSGLVIALALACWWFETDDLPASRDIIVVHPRKETP